MLRLVAVMVVVAGRSAVLGLLLTVVLGCGSASHDQPQSRSSASPSSPETHEEAGVPPERMLINGVEVQRQGTASFEMVQVALDDVSQLIVRAGQDHPGKPNPCSVEAVVRRLAEDDREIRVGVYLYRTVQQLGANEGCTAIGYAAKKFVVQLDGPVAGRDVVDVSSDRAVTLVDPARLLQVTRVPDGYNATGELEVEQLPSRGGLVTMWTYEGNERGSAIHLKQGTPQAVEPREGGRQVLGRYTVHEHPAVFDQAPGFPDVKCLRWRESDQLSVVLCTRGDPEAPLDGAAVARMADSVSPGG